MGIIEMLNEYPFLLERIKEIQKEIAELKERQRNAEEALQATRITDMPKNPNIIDPVSELVTKILTTYVEQITKLINQELDLTLRKVRVENLLKELTPKEYMVIRLRHFEGLKFYQIARRIFYSKTATWDFYQEIIRKLQELANKSEHSERAIS